MKNLEQAFYGYFKRDVFVFFFLGLSCAIPLALLGNTLTTWATDALSDLPKEEILKRIGLFALMMMPYSVKFLWSPFIERFDCPFLRKIGRKKAWGLIAQIGLFVSIMIVSFINIKDQTIFLFYTCLFMAFFGASQDIVVDSLRIDTLDGDKLKQGSAIYQFGARIGLFVAGPVLIILSKHFSWLVCYQIGALLVLPGILALLLIQERESQIKPSLKTMLFDPFTDFIYRHKHWFALLVFVILYKVCNTVLGKMAYPLYYDLKFTKEEVSIISGTLGPWITMFGVFLGGLLMVRTSYYRLMLGLGFVEILTSVTFAGLALCGHNLPLFFLAIVFDNIVGGMGSAVFVAFLSSLCSKNYSATQYALLTSFMAISSSFIASSSGYLASFLGWGPFCIFTGILMLPALALLIWIMKNDTKEKAL